MLALYGQLGVGAGDAQPINGQTDVGTHDGDAAREACNGAEEVAKENHNSIAFYQEANKGPAQ